MDYCEVTDFFMRETFKEKVSHSYTSFSKQKPYLELTPKQ